MLETCNRHYTPFTLMRFKPHFSAVVQIYLSAEGCGFLVLRNVTEVLRFDCGQSSSFMGLLGILQFPAWLELH